MKNKEITLKHIDGRVVTYPSITKFAQVHHCSKYHISQILNKGKLVNRGLYKGWYDPTPLEKPITLVDQNNNYHKVYHPIEFCLENKLSRTMVNKLLSDKALWYNGLRKTYTPKPFIKPEKTKYEYTFISPNKKEIKTDNICRVAKMIHVDRSILYRLGRDKHSHRGWRLIDMKEIV